MRTIYRNTLLAITFGAITIASSSCSSVNIAQASSAGIKAIQAATISDAQVEAIVSQYIKQLDAESSIATANDPYTQRINRITNSFNNRDGINIKVYKTKDVNAFAVADGSIRVYSGLMDIMSDEEILGVIGHEIGHVHNKDTKEAFRRALLSSSLREALASTGGVIGALSASQMGALTEAVVQSQYSQKQELAADDYGYDFLKRHGINPWAMPLSLSRLKEMEGGARSSGVEQLLSTHPELDTRMRRLEKRAVNEGYKNPETTGAGFTISSGSTSTVGNTAGTSSEWSF